MQPRCINSFLIILYIFIVTVVSPSDVRRSAAEPTCEELRIMWRTSRRQSRTAEHTNIIPKLKDPLAPNIWAQRAVTRSKHIDKFRTQDLIYDSVRPTVENENIPQERIRAIEAQLLSSKTNYPSYKDSNIPIAVRLAGGHKLQNWNKLTGSFQRLKELVQIERARELREQKLSEETARRILRLQYYYHHPHYRPGRVRGRMGNYPNLYFLQRIMTHPEEEDTP